MQFQAKIENILKGSLDSIPLPSSSVKIQSLLEVKTASALTYSRLPKEIVFLKKDFKQTENPYVLSSSLFTTLGHIVQ